MQDRAGTEVEVGDIVYAIVPTYSMLASGKIVKINPKSVTIEYYNTIYRSMMTTSRRSTQFVKG